jgi:hypothetical protein
MPARAANCLQAFAADQQPRGRFQVGDHRAPGQKLEVGELSKKSDRASFPLTLPAR